LFRNRRKITITIIENNEVVEVQIHNNGKGIKEEDFEPFLISSINLSKSKCKKPVEAV
jgi:signal transduction histidine kinase